MRARFLDLAAQGVPPPASECELRERVDLASSCAGEIRGIGATRCSLAPSVVSTGSITTISYSKPAVPKESCDANQYNGGPDKYHDRPQNRVSRSSSGVLGTGEVWAVRILRHKPKSSSRISPLDRNRWPAIRSCTPEPKVRSSLEQQFAHATQPHSTLVPYYAPIA